MKSRSRNVFAWVTVAGWALTADAAGASEKPAPSTTVDTGTLAFYAGWTRATAALTAVSRTFDK